MNKFYKFVAVVGLLACAPSIQAQERERNNDMPSGAGIWRIELRDLERFLATSSGDTDGVSEMHWVRVRLTGREGQSQSVTETNPFLSIDGGTTSSGNSINVRPNDEVHLERFTDGQTDTYNMWVHTAELTGGDIEGPRLRFEIRVDAHELDCAGDRACRRGSTGAVTYVVTIPVPARRDNTCNAHNTYRITRAANTNMVLEPLNAASGRGNAVTVGYTTSGGHIVSLGARGENSGVELAMINGRVCAAWTGG
ncbi:hypothetical protein DS901_12420 [Loktanella sp. D2R18]|uniref:hypothetical protein n=1 Tax=Rhodobacterales TaxID=204455 RepID=UPI000DE974C4|nr:MULTISPECIES: hypothetical protein [Rhodobacterales]MDO6592116.1 hypothetical protein [Yoonia sp. 1_MG-2023]RBW42726.1 hypothetical protein DS901_12420 [Loktanella sp. D2R18]